MGESPALRVLDAGVVSPVRSQTLWHALAYGVSRTGVPTLCFLRPAGSYACLGYHRQLDELDLDHCARAGLPVLRRMVGGGPVYLDRDQVFFQIVLPVEAVPASRVQAVERLLAPAVAAFRDCGVPAGLDQGEICVGDRKICGHGAGQIESAVVVCGNLIRRFDHAAATRILRLPRLAARVEVERLMRRYVAATAVEAGRFQQALTRSYAAALGLSPRPGRLNDHEEQVLADLDRRFVDPHWLAGPAPQRSRPVHIKIREGVRVAYSRWGAASVLISSVRGRVVHAQAWTGRRPHPRLARVLLGRDLGDLPAVLRAALPPGPQVDHLAAELAA